jgi:hypothetical protein
MDKQEQKQRKQDEQSLNRLLEKLLKTPNEVSAEELGTALGKITDKKLRI